MDQKTVKLVIDNSVVGKRLDLAIGFLYPILSRSSIKKIIESNLCKVNGEVEFHANRKVLVDDKIEFTVDESSVEDKIVPENIPLDVLYEDKDLIAINKPAGMVVHPATGNWHGTVMNALLYKFSSLKEFGENLRSGLIHRLDKDTSGLLLIGKTTQGLWHYSKQFANRQVEKNYIAVGRGVLPKALKVSKQMEIKNYLGRNKENRKKMEVVGTLDSGQNHLTPDARMAYSIVNIVESNENNHLFYVTPKTGRTHQIRVHLSSISNPIIGDKVYGGFRNDRMLLHAHKLRLKNLKGEILEIVAPLDLDFKNNLEKFGLTKTF